MMKMNDNRLIMLRQKLAYKTFCVYEFENRIVNLKKRFNEVVSEYHEVVKSIIGDQYFENGSGI